MLRCTTSTSSRVSPSPLHLSGHFMLQSENLLWTLLFRFGHPRPAPHRAAIKLYQLSAFIHSDAFSEFCSQICWCTICCTFPEYSQLALPVFCEAAPGDTMTQWQEWSLTIKWEMFCEGESLREKVPRCQGLAGAASAWPLVLEKVPSEGSKSRRRPLLGPSPG